MTSKTAVWSGVAFQESLGLRAEDAGIHLDHLTEETSELRTDNPARLYRVNAGPAGREWGSVAIAPVAVDVRVLALDPVDPHWELPLIRTRDIGTTSPRTVAALVMAAIQQHHGEAG